MEKATTFLALLISFADGVGCIGLQVWRWRAEGRGPRLIKPTWEESETYNYWARRNRFHIADGSLCDLIHSSLQVS